MWVFSFSLASETQLLYQGAIMQNYVHFLPEDSLIVNSTDSYSRLLSLVPHHETVTCGFGPLRHPQAPHLPSVYHSALHRLSNHHEPKSQLQKKNGKVKKKCSRS